jgi:acetyltransferase-like isoleucine patch superfamily enzyme
MIAQNGSDAIVGAGAVVTKHLPAGVVAYGNPAAIKR